LWRQHAGLTVPLEQDTIDVYVETSTGLPSAMVFRIRPYVAPGKAPPPHIRPHLGLEEVRFSNYQLVDGREIPMRIQAVMRNQISTRIQAATRSKPIFDLAFTGAAFNQGLALAALQ